MLENKTTITTTTTNKAKWLDGIEFIMKESILSIGTAYHDVDRCRRVRFAISVRGNGHCVL